ADLFPPAGHRRRRDDQHLLVDYHCTARRTASGHSRGPAARRNSVASHLRLTRSTRESSMASIVSFKNVVKRYTRGKQKVEVLHGIDLECEEGEFLALMGPSGSGKTTLLNLIGGLDRADQGEVSVGGQRLDRLSGGQLAKWRARHVGFI